jgi:hypothetical protein
MAVDLHVAPDPDDLAVFADQYRGAKNALEGSSIHGFFAPGSVGLEHAVGLVRNKRHHQLVLVAKGLLGLWRVGRDSQYGGSVFGERARQSREVDRLAGAARSIRARIEKQHQPATGEVLERDSVAAILGRRKPGAGAPSVSDRISGVAVAAFDSVAFRAAAALGRDDFLKGLEAGLRVIFGRAVPTALPVFLPDLPGDFAARVLADAFDDVRAAFADAFLRVVLEEFLRVFLDIRLPFVAFGGSIIRLLRVESRRAQIEPAAGQV